MSLDNILALLAGATTHAQLAVIGAWILSLPDNRLKISLGQRWVAATARVRAFSS